MSGSQGRFPPVVPPQTQRRAPGEYDRSGQNPQQMPPEWAPAQPLPGQQFGGHPTFQPPSSPQPSGQWPPQGQLPPSMQPQQGGYHQPPAPAGQRRDAAGFDNFGQATGRPTAPPAYPAQRPEPTDYDLGSYAVAPGPGQPAPHWQAQHAQPPQYAPQHASQHAAQYSPQHGNLPSSQYAEPHDEVEYDDPPRRGKRWLIVAALVGSIGVGGGMAYSYKYMFPAKPDGKVDVVRRPTQPAKTEPDDRGGKRFANSDNRFANRVPADGAGGVASGGEVDSNGVRRVQTVAVGKDLQNSGPAFATAQPAINIGAGRQSSVPGMTIVGSDGMAGAGAMPPMPSSMQQPSRGLPPMPTQSQSAQPPRVAAQPPPAQPRPQVVARAAPAEPTAIDGPVTSVPAREPVRRAAAQPPADAAPGAAAAKIKPSTSGFVAVLGYQKSQIDAMRMMADMQQKYEVLRDRKLEVIQSDQTSRGLGVIYRVVVGPRAGLEAAKSVCSQLSQAGHPANGCYTMPN